jgi:hypothetical protein
MAKPIGADGAPSHLDLGVAYDDYDEMGPAKLERR